MKAIPIGLACCLAIASVVELSADYKESYRRGFQARNRRNWTEAVRWFTRAIEERPVETGESVFMTQGSFEPYLPYFQLGLSHYQMQDCVPALEAWKKSLEAQVVLRSKYAETFKKAQFDCEGRVAKGEAARPAAPPEPAPPSSKSAAVDPAALEPAVAAAQAAIASAERLLGVVHTLAGHALLKSEFVLQSELTGGQARAQTFLADARSALDKGQRTPDLEIVRSAASLAASAEQQLALLQKAAESRIDALEQARQTNTPAPPAPPASSSIPPAAPPVSANPPPEPVKPTAGALTTPSPPAKPDPSLLGLYDAFTSGRYRDAIARAAKLQHLTGRDGAHAALFSAASNYQLFLRGGERDRALRDAAVRDASRARRLDPELQPDLRVFSPRFAEFYRGVR
jgi:tetratricopeptide (TPR) repeat protein